MEQRIKKVERDGLTAVSEAAPGIDTHTLPICRRFVVLLSCEQGDREIALTKDMTGGQSAVDPGNVSIFEICWHWAIQRAERCGLCARCVDDERAAYGTCYSRP